MQKNIGTHNLSEEVIQVIRCSFIGCVGLMAIISAIFLLIYWFWFSYQEKTPIELEQNEPKIKEKVRTVLLNRKQKGSIT